MRFLRGVKKGMTRDKIENQYIKQNPKVECLQEKLINLMLDWYKHVTHE